jgi:hypothetical protein
MTPENETNKAAPPALTPDEEKVVLIRAQYIFAAQLRDNDENFQDALRDLAVKYARLEIISGRG